MLCTRKVLMCCISVFFGSRYCLICSLMHWLTRNMSLNFHMLCPNSNARSKVMNIYSSVDLVSCNPVNLFISLDSFVASLICMCRVISHLHSFVFSHLDAFYFYLGLIALAATPTTMLDIPSCFKIYF